jgi:guanylate kinase
MRAELAAERAVVVKAALVDDREEWEKAAKPISENFEQCTVKKKPPRPLIIAGPSGVGKGTLIEKLQRTFPGLFGFSVSHTTRAPRPGEIDGKSYHFTSAEAMEAAIARGEFLEHAKVHGNLYGTSFAAVMSVASEDKICILDIDTQGVQSVKAAPKSSMPGTPHFVFVAPPSLEALEQRLRGRGTESAEKMTLRLANAKVGPNPDPDPNATVGKDPYPDPTRYGG